MKHLDHPSVGCAVVMIAVDVTEGNPDGCLTINETDFDAETMTLFGEVPVVPAAPAAPAAPVAGGATPSWAKS